MALITLRQLLDHADNEANCLSAIRHGFTSVMMDGSSSVPGQLQDVINQFGGHASKITPLNMDEMAQRYADGALDPVVN